MTHLEREHLLQKVVAVTGFLFALLILPIAQYYLVNGREQAAQQDTGSVAGVSTSKVAGDVPPQTPAQCEAQKQKDLRDLQSFEDGKMAALEREYNAAIAPYQAALPLQPNDTEKAALNKLIADETDSYTTKRAQVTTAVDAQTKDISSRDCSAPTPVPSATP